MAETTIEWTATHHPDGTVTPGYTFNPWIGSTKVHEGCKHCYAETLMGSRYGIVEWGPNGTRTMTSDSNWRKPLQWNRAAEKAGVRAKVFCASLADVFEDWKGGRDEGAMTCHRTGEELSINDNGHVWPSGWPSMGDGDDWGIRPYTMNDARQRLFDLIDATPHMDWLLLTKRPENIRTMWADEKRRDNVWLGTSISNADHYGQIAELKKSRNLSPVLFLSIEPLLGPMENLPLDGIDWVIVGGESGHGARPMHPEWVRSIRDQCADAGVAFFFKQWGEHAAIDQLPEDAYEACQNAMTSMQRDSDIHRFGKKVTGRLLDGVEWNQFPGQVVTK